MPSFDLRGIKIGKYVNTAGTITYTNQTELGDAMACNLDFRFAEGRLYAEGKLAEYLRLATGGTLSIAAKYIKAAAQSLMYGATQTTSTTPTTTGIKYTAKDEAKYVGVGFYAPDMIDGERKFTCVFVSKALFGPPAMSYQTKGENIVFSTPTTTGEFLPDDGSDELMIDTAVAASASDAVSWINGMFGESD